MTTATAATLLDDYLRGFAAARPATLTVVGPLLAAPPRATALREPLVWVDGGVAHRCGGDGVADRIGFAVGDGDSAQHALDQYLSADKDYSDLAYVLRRLSAYEPAHFDEVVLLGFLGARRDHELFNLGEVHRFLAAAKTPTRARFDRDIVAYSKGEWTFEARAAFSLAVLAPTKLQLTGACKYQIATPTELDALTSLGLSNQGFGEITLRTQGPAFILLCGIQ
ncbi:MAG: hypothetical protein ACR2P7_02855 [bacterium]